jgi:colanic acid/amylovoran biosynthesis protein
MKYALINCYSDNNRGDLAIILATIQLIREHDKNAEISGISTYNSTDPCYESEHKLLGEHIRVFPSLFGVVNVGTSRALPLKLLRFGFDTLRIALCMVLPRGLISLLFSDAENSSIRQLLEADYVVSKGGSFICSERDLRSQIALIRVLYIFLLSIKLGKPPIVLCQSVGPYYGWLTRLLTNHVLKRCAAVILREDVCTEQYGYIELPEFNQVATDIAFFADAHSAPTDLPFAFDRLRVGMTMKHVNPEQSEQYRDMFVAAIKHCVNHHNARVYIFPHVTIEDDIGNAFEIYKRLPDKIKPYVVLLSNDYHALQLKAIYKSMDVFVGTRLHSTIFALSEHVPAICVTYHGTKAFGVFKTLGLEEFVMTKYDAVLFCEKIDRLVSERKEISERIAHILTQRKFELMRIFKAIMPAPNVD